MSNKFPLVQRVDFLKEKCRGKKVLHLGCTNFPFTEDSLEKNMLLHLQLKEYAAEIYGFDYDQKGIDLLNSKGINHLYRADLEHLEDLDFDETFDVIVAGEMIEHLLNPGLFLKGIQRFMNPQTELLVTTVNAYCGMRFWLYGLRGKKGLNEPVHPDHMAYYSYSTLKLIVEKSGLKVPEFYFYDVGKEHRPHFPWYYSFVNDVSVKIAPQWADGVIAVCKL